MSGWSAVGLATAVLLIVAVAAARWAAVGWRGWLAIVPLAIVLMYQLVTYVFGDVSRYAPAGTFAETAEGKEQVIAGGVLCTVLSGVILATLAVGALARMWHLRR